MTRNFIFRIALASLTLMAFGLYAQEKPALPKPPVLTPGTVTAVQGTAIYCQVTTTEYQSVSEARKVIKQGQIVVETVTKQIPYSAVKTIVFDVTSIRAYKTGARSDDPTKTLEPIETAPLINHLRKMPQVMVAQGGIVKPEDVKDIKPGTVILAPPRPQDPPKVPEKK